jgi:rhamnosyltransferase
MRVSVIIPTKNGGEGFRELLAALSIQSLQPDETLIVDSSSEDGTVQTARSFGAAVYRIEPEEFSHGGTRTMAAGLAGGEILVFLTQDVLPASRDLLARLVQPILDDPQVDVCYSRQLPSFDATAIAAHLRLFNYPELSSERTFQDRERFGLKTVFVSNSCAAYRRSSLAEINFFDASLIFGEDSWAAGKLLEKGGKIVYVAEAAVYHSHNYSWDEEFRRYFDIGVFHQRGEWLLDTYGGAGQRGLDYVRSGLGYLWQRRRYSIIVDFMVRVGLKFCGYRLGRAHRFLPERIARNLSMNRCWWANNVHGNSS